MNTTSLDLFFLYTYIVITNRFLFYGDETDNYHIGFSGIKKSQLNSKILKLSGLHIKSCFPEYPKSKRNSRGTPETSVATQEDT